MNDRQGSPTRKRDSIRAFAALAEAATNRQPVVGWTHNFYRYPARFSPQFASAAITLFSRPGDLVLDPYMGGGTSIVEGIVAGRRMVGNDLNSLAGFITKVKITGLRKYETSAIRRWATETVPGLTYLLPSREVIDFIDPVKTFNLTLPRARFIKKVVAGALASIEQLPSTKAQDLARCAVLRVSQWALDGRERHTSVSAFRDRLAETAKEMVKAVQAFAKQAGRSGGSGVIVHGDASDLGSSSVFRNEKASLVVTSPPYPGVHVLYHRWQVDGRRETPAPYWIAGCNDGQGGSYYNFCDRRDRAMDRYFAASLKTLRAIRSVIRTGSYMIQLVAFNQPERQLPRYLRNMEEAGFEELSAGGDAERIWRQVPGRKWHARQLGKTNSSNEVALIHRAN
jgi:DNA modification methylase